MTRQSLHDANITLLHLQRDTMHKFSLRAGENVGQVANINFRRKSVSENEQFPDVFQKER